MREIKETESLCPECLKVLPATIYEDARKVYIRKSCPEHGEFKDLYWGDYDEYERAQKFDYLGTKLSNPQTKVEKGCPNDCGICPEHKSHTILAIVDITNRCNLRCPICFAHAGVAGYLYEPTFEEIRGMFAKLLANDPIAPPAIQFSGGEPTVRDDLPELIRTAKDMGFRHVEINSNGIRMAESIEYCRTLKKAGASTVYLQFDGVTAEPYIIARGHNLLPIKLKALENLKAGGFKSIVLVPVLVGGVNDDQVGDIIRFAIEHKDVVRCINFQPVSITGRINKRERERMRITIPDLIQLAEEQTDGLVKRSDWYPVTTAMPFSTFVGNLKNRKYVDFSAHPHCGMATYLIIEDGKPQPITKYFEVDHFIDSLIAANKRLEKGQRTRAKMAMATAALKNIDLGMFRKYILPLFTHGSYESLSELHHKMIMIGSMHFMDPYNFDLERVQRCVIHYAIPDGRVIPFCTMNTLHRQTIEKNFAQHLDASNLTPMADIEALMAKVQSEG